VGELAGASRGAIGGAASETGAVHRSSVGAVAVVYGLRGQPVPGLGLSGAPVRVDAEADTAVDDLVVTASDGARALVQAKASGDMGVSLRDTVAQWCGAVRAGLGDGDSLVMACANVSAPLRALQSALDKRRAGSSLSEPEKRALKSLTAMIVELDDVGQALVLDRARVAVFDTASAGGIASNAALMLDGPVVAVGDGVASFAVLRERISRLAADRGHGGVDAWMRWLREAGLPCVADPEGSFAARRQAEFDALLGWRRRWAARLDVVPLDGFGAGVEPMERPGVSSSIRGVPLDGDGSGRRRDSVGVLDAARGIGRVLLVGGGGSGKSFALRQIGGRAASSSVGPTPLFVSLARLAARLDADRVTPLRADEVVALAVGTGDTVVEAALLREAVAGRVVWLFDGLDECGAARDRVIGALREFLEGLPSGSGVVVASRHSAADAASVLGLLRLELTVPLDQDSVTDALVRHLGDALVPAQERDRWRSWVGDQLAAMRYQHRDVWSVPLFAALGCLWFVRHRDDQSRLTRARLLRDIVGDGVAVWIAQRGDASVGSAAALSQAMLVDTFPDAANSVMAGEDWSQTRDAVAQRLRDHWELSAGAAVATARDVLNYWDGSAGVFVSERREGPLQPRVRLIGELGQALFRVRDAGRDELLAWMGPAVDDAEQHERLRLAAALDRLAAQVLLSVALERGDAVLDLAIHAVGDGALLDAAEIERLVDAQLARLPTLSRQTPTPSRASGGDARRFVLALQRAPEAAVMLSNLVELPLTAAQARQICDELDGFSETQEAVLTALAMSSSADVDPDEVRAVMREAVDAVAGTAREEGPERERVAGVDLLVRRAIDVLLPQDPDAAESIAWTARRTSMHTYATTSTELRSLGYAAATAPVMRKVAEESKPMYDALASLRFMTDLPYHLLGPGSTEPGPALELDSTQRWAAADAARLIAAAGISDLTPGELRVGSEHADALRPLIRVVAGMHSIDYDAAVAEMRSVIGEGEVTDWSFLLVAAEHVTLPETAAAPDSAALAFDALRCGGRFAGGLAFLVLSAFESLSEEDLQVLEGLVPDLDPFASFVVGIILGGNNSDMAILGEHALARAGYAAALADEAEHVEDVAEFLSDPDSTVRATVLSYLGDDLRASAEALAAGAAPASVATCRHCGHDNSPEVTSCARCNTVLRSGQG
jgi:hypothetical protein